MDVERSLLHENKMAAVSACLLSFLLLLLTYFYWSGAMDYRPSSQRIFLNTYNQPVGQQDLLVDTFHNPQYRKSTTEGETPGDFLKHAVLNLFTYKKSDLEDGTMLKRFKLWCSEDAAEQLYTNNFVNLGQQRVVMAQDGLVRARVIGDFKYIGKAVRRYESMSGLVMPALTHKFEGRMLVSTYGDKAYPTFYTVTALVQRAMLQDRLAGYQIVELEMR